MILLQKQLCAARSLNKCHKLGGCLRPWWVEPLLWLCGHPGGGSSRWSTADYCDKWDVGGIRDPREVRGAQYPGPTLQHSHCIVAMPPGTPAPPRLKRSHGCAVFQALAYCLIPHVAGKQVELSQVPCCSPGHEGWMEGSVELPFCTCCRATRAQS